MKSTTKKIATALVLSAAALAGTSASAQGWGYNRGYGNNYNTDRVLIETTCSGQRGYNMEKLLREAVDSGRMNRGDAGQIQYRIDQLQQREARECREHDYSAAREIGQDYIRLRTWIDQEAGRGYGYNGYRNGYGNGYNNGYRRGW